MLTPRSPSRRRSRACATIPAVHHIMGDNQMNVVIITLIIVCLLFAVQRAGTSKIGRAFGPVATFWFLFLGGAGLVHILDNPIVLAASTTLRGIASC
ncbi:MAG: KUP/HAK/KT family potassium transporter [Collinsella sp.]